MAAKWKAPDRPGFEISQAYNDGLVDIMTVTDTAAPGYAPVRTETVKHTLPFAERTVGVRRYYEANKTRSMFPVSSAFRRCRESRHRMWQ